MTMTCSGKISTRILGNVGVVSKLSRRIGWQAARLELTEEQLNSVNRSSQAHLLLVVLVVLGTVQYGGNMPAGYWTGVLAFPPRIAFLVGGLCGVAGVAGTSSPKELAQETASVIAKFTVGLGVGVFLCF